MNNRVNTLYNWFYLLFSCHLHHFTSKEATRDDVWTVETFRSCRHAVAYTFCVSRHMFFELCYAPCIWDAAARRRTISQAYNYAAGKSCNVILCGGVSVCSCWEHNQQSV